MDDLIQRLEKLTGPDREVDAEIALAAVQEFAGWQRHPFYGPDAPLWMAGELVPSKEAFIRWRDHNVDEGAPTAVPRYTASVDAALSLAGDDFEDALAEASAEIEYGRGPTTTDRLARLICAAALRARAA